MPIGPMRTDAPPAAEKVQRNSALWTLSTPKYQMEDVILSQATSARLADALSYFENKELLFFKWGLRERYSDKEGLSINLYGAPGTGKTMAAHAIASRLALPMICVDYAEIESKYVGETSKNLSSLFQTAEKSGAVIFFDEADALLSKRVTNMTSATDVSVNQTRSVLLNLMNTYQGVLVFATNFIQNFDPAFLRRIKYHIQFDLPDLEGRKKLWKAYIPAKMPHDLDISEIAQKYEGISGSDISNAVFSAAVCAARNHENLVTTKRFEDAIQAAIDVKKANSSGEITITSRRITEDELREKLNLEGTK